MDVHPFDGSTGEALCGLIPGWHEAKHTHGYAYGLDSGATRRPRVPFPKSTKNRRYAGVANSSIPSCCLALLDQVSSKMPGPPAIK